jgi:hypothetical protein
MSIITRLVGFVCICSLLGARAHAQEWRFDVIHLKNKETFEGLIVRESKEEVLFNRVVREPGAPTRAMLLPISREEIARIDRLSEEHRKQLLERIEQLDPRGEKEERRMRLLRLDRGDWPGGGQAWAYSCKHFTLLSNAREDIVRRVIVRLEEIFQAYVDNLGSRRSPAQVTRVLFFKSRAEYQASLRPGMNILNPAYYDAATNEIVAASDLEERAEELARLREKHDAMLRELEDQERKLRKHYHGQPPAPMLAQLRQARQRIHSLNSENQDTYERLNRPLFSTFYHEAFHAYLECFAHPSREAPVPRWLNEGLAQVFETALVETGELRVGHVDARRLSAVQELVRKKQFPTLEQILNSGNKEYQVAHMSDALRSDRSFQAAWALAFYLFFERKALGHPALEKYVERLQRGTDAREAFRELVGQPLPEFERQFQQFILALRGDGSRREAEKP